jgi:hypothetical protein
MNDEIDAAFERLGDSMAKQSSAAMPAILLSNEILTGNVYVFDLSLKQIVEQMNTSVGFNYVTVRKEGPFMWTMMGSDFCEFVEIRLDPCFFFFDLLAHLPFTKTIRWMIYTNNIEHNIKYALKALHG